MIYSKMHPVSYTNIYHDVTDFVNHEMDKNTKTLMYFREGSITFLRNKNSQPVPQMTHFEKLSFCSGCNLQKLVL